jgi:hypothetical protein
MPLSSRDGRREAMRERVRASIADRLSGDEEADQALLDQELESQARNVGRQNVSRAISDLVKAGLVTRHYAGYATNHINRGAGRHAVYVLSPIALRALGKPAVTTESKPSLAFKAVIVQPDLFGMAGR